MDRRVENHLGNTPPPVRPTEIRTSISPSSAVESLVDYATEAVQLSKERQPELLANEKIKPPENNETGIVKSGTSRSEDPEFMNVDEGFQLLNASLTLIDKLPVGERAVRGVLASLVRMQHEPLLTAA
uniref:(California timema) hypothetical protein n=1 Tax=Timema californicum TaxID=61474 RepID=A0A7R9J1P1_TIMCA|nr:unnamed protein product [Timema californicum]